jgi:penicillin-binding protein 1C
LCGYVHGDNGRNLGSPGSSRRLAGAWRYALQVVALACFGSYMPLALAATSPVPAFVDVRTSFSTSEAQLLDRNGVVLATQRVDAHARRLDWVALADISPTVAAALVAAEDKRFYEHAGVDWVGFGSAAWDSVWRTFDGRRPRGASTLTMQLAGLLDPTLAIAVNTRTLGQKWDQAQAALALERTWTKAQIIEAYLNVTAYRGELTGIDAAARGLFGKAPAGLDAREAAILVALLRGPNAPAATVAQRACLVAAVSAPRLACEDVRASAMVALAGAYRMAQRDSAAPHLAARLLKVPGSRVTTTLDADLQRYAIADLRDHLAELADRAVGDGAIVVLDNASGDVLAWVGSSGELSAAAQVDGVVALRQAGSTLKPFLYALALNSRLLTAASLVDDSPVAIATARGAYVPQNYDRSFRGTVSVRTALASSLNVPAVRTVELVGVDRFYDTLRQLGLDSLTEPADFYGASLALGGADVTLLTLANAYRALANGGQWSATQLVADGSGSAPRRVFAPQAAFIIGDILADRGARAASFGLENALATRVWSAVKTGTSKDMRDNWCVGFTSRYTVGVWVGNFSGAPMRDVSGVTGAAPIWRDIVHHLHAREASMPPRAPAGVSRESVAFEPDVEAERSEWFMRGTETAVVRSSSSDSSVTTATPAIRYPTADTIIALDPDIPAGRERVVFSAAPAIAGMRWRIDDAVLPAERGRADWAPVPGRHTLSLEDASGRTLSTVAFEVRGNPAP